MIVVVGGIKGGSGKTTIATNLAVMRSLSGAKILLVDADEQKSASDWAQQRALHEIDDSLTTIELSGKGVYSQVQKMGADYDDVIIDVGGRDTTSQRSALTIADILLLPFKPRSLDIWTAGPVKMMINELKVVNPGLICIAMINQADATGTDNEDALDALKENEDIQCFEGSVGHRKAFGNAASEGLGVIELDVQDKKANKEIRALYEYVYTALVVSDMKI